MSGSLLVNQTSVNEKSNFFAGINQTYTSPPEQATFLNPNMEANGENTLGTSVFNDDLARYPSGWYLIGVNFVVSTTTVDSVLSWGFKLTSGSLGGGGNIISGPSYQTSSFLSNSLSDSPYNIVQIMYAPSAFNNIIFVAWNATTLTPEITATISEYVLIPLQINGAIV